MEIIICCLIFDQLHKHTGKDNIYCCICIHTLIPVLLTQSILEDLKNTTIL